MAHDSLLRPGEGEGQRLHQRIGERVLVGHARRRLAAPLAIGDAHGELLREELVELEAAPRGVRALGEACRVHVGRRAVQQQHALAEPPPAQGDRAAPRPACRRGGACRAHAR